MPNRQAEFRAFFAEAPRNDMVLKIIWGLASEDSQIEVKFTSAHLPESGGSVPLPVKEVARQLVDRRVLLSEVLQQLRVAASECDGINVEFRAPKGQKRVLMRWLIDGNANMPAYLTLLVYEKV